MGNLKPAPGYFVIMATANVNFYNVTTGDTLVLELSDVTSGRPSSPPPAYMAKDSYNNRSTRHHFVQFRCAHVPRRRVSKLGLAGYFLLPFRQRRPLLRRQLQPDRNVFSPAERLT